MITWYPSRFTRRPRLRDFPISVMYGYVRTRQLEQTHKQGRKVGCYLLNAQRISAGWGFVSASRWPPFKRNDSWPPINLRPELDTIARFNRSFAHFRVRSSDEATKCLAFHGPFMMSLPIHKDWYASKDGRIGMPPQPFTPAERHAICVTGYNIPESSISFINSWGPSWGDKGHGTIDFAYFDQYLDEAWARNMFPPPMPALEYNKHKFVCTRQIFPTLDFFQIVCSYWEAPTNTRLGWAMLVIRDDYCELEDFFFRQRFQTAEHLDRLIDSMLTTLTYVGMPLRFWIPHCDHYRSRNYAAVNHLVKRLELRVSRSAERWAAYKAE